MEFKDKFIAFVDILGFKGLVEEAAAGTGLALSELLELLKNFGSPEERDKFTKHGPMTCPQSAYLQRDLNFRLTQLSDCAIVSTEISPAGVINLVSHCWGIVINLMHSGIMCRGYITRGAIFHTDSQVIGPGYQNAYENESKVAAFKRQADERGTPFVEVDRSVCEYVRQCEDKCVKEMFSRCVKDDGEVVALFPFKRLAHSFIIGGDWGHKFDPEKERQSNQNLRLLITRLKERVMSFVDTSNPSAVTKAEHYIEALNAQLAVCDDTDRAISMLSSPFTKLPRNTSRRTSKP